MNNLPAAAANLQGLFARIYGIWSWNGNRYVQDDLEGVNFDVSASTGTNPSITNPNITPNQVSAQGGVINLRFNTSINADQAPIRTLLVNWGDGQVDSLNWLNSKPSGQPPFSFNHSFSCLIAPNGRSCLVCQGSGVLANGRCTYTIRGTVEDNWEKTSNSQSLGTVVVGD